MRAAVKSTASHSVVFCVKQGGQAVWYGTVPPTASQVSACSDRGGRAAYGAERGTSSERVSARRRVLGECLPGAVLAAFQDEGRTSRHPCLGAVWPSMAWKCGVWRIASPKGWTASTMAPANGPPLAVEQNCATQEKIGRAIWPKMRWS